MSDAERSPGQLLHELHTHFFQGGGWADAPEWADYNEAGQAAWEAMAETIGSNLKAVRFLPELIDALRHIAALEPTCDREGIRDDAVQETARHALGLLEATTPEAPLLRALEAQNV